VYDADGRRVQKSVSATVTNYWYGPGGLILSETDSSGTAMNYIFFGGKRLARNVNGDIKYFITDHLHSTAMFVDKAGTNTAILDDNDFYSWGAVVPGVGQTTSNNHYKFTGKERDAESNLDYFGQRYYGSVLGRWMTADSPFADQKAGNPQSWNLYEYARNNPLNQIDTNGAESITAAWAAASSQIDKLAASNPGSTYSIALAGILSPNGNSEFTSFSGHAGLGKIESGVNFVSVPTGRGFMGDIFAALGGCPSKTQFGVARAILAKAFSSGLHVALFSQSNGVNALGLLAKGLAPKSIDVSVIHAPNIDSFAAVDSMVKASKVTYIIQSEDDWALNLGASRDLAAYQARYADNPSVIVKQVPGGSHSVGNLATAVLPGGSPDPERSWWYFDPSDMNAFSNWLACSACQVSPWNQPIVRN